MNLIIKLKKWWFMETPTIARILQTIFSAIAAIPLYYSSLPIEFQQTLPVSFLKYITISGLILTFILQFFNKKTV